MVWTSIQCIYMSTFIVSHSKEGNFADDLRLILIILFRYFWIEILTRLRWILQVFSCVLDHGILLEWLSVRYLVDSLQVYLLYGEGFWTLFAFYQQCGNVDSLSSMNALQLSGYYWVSSSNPHMVISGNEAAVAARFTELLAAGLDELNVSLVPMTDAGNEQSQLMHLIGQL